MKKNIFILFVGFFGLINAQEPNGYYSTVTGLSGYAMKTKLGEIISAGYQTKSYDNLYNGYPSTDSDNFYEKDGSVLDVYSENPTGSDPYNYTHGQKKRELRIIAKKKSFWKSNLLYFILIFFEVSR